MFISSFSTQAAIGCLVFAFRNHSLLLPGLKTRCGRSHYKLTDSVSRLRDGYHAHWNSWESCLPCTYCFGVQFVLKIAMLAKICKRIGWNSPLCRQPAWGACLTTVSYKTYFDNTVMYSHSVGLLKMSEFQSYNLTGVTLLWITTKIFSVLLRINRKLKQKQKS